MAVDDAYTKALLHMEGADESTTFTDESGKTWTANSNAKIDSAQAKFGSTSGNFAGTDDYISTPSDTDFDIHGNVTWTIDCWIYTAGGGLYTIISRTEGGDDFSGWYIRLQNDDAVLVVTDDNVVRLDTDTDVIATNQWCHLAIVRTGGDIKVAIDGTFSAITWTGQLQDPGNVQVLIGDVDGAAIEFVGWIDEMRFSNGIARWTTNFTPPIRPYGPPSGGNFFNLF